MTPEIYEEKKELVVTNIETLITRTSVCIDFSHSSLRITGIWVNLSTYIKTRVFTAF